MFYSLRPLAARSSSVSLLSANSGATSSRTFGASAASFLADTPLAVVAKASATFSVTASGNSGRLAMPLAMAAACRVVISRPEPPSSALRGCSWSALASPHHRMEAVGTTSAVDLLDATGTSAGR